MATLIASTADTHEHRVDVSEAQQALDDFKKQKGQFGGEWFRAEEPGGGIERWVRYDQVTSIRIEV